MRILASFARVFLPAVFDVSELYAPARQRHVVLVFPAVPLAPKPLSIYPPLFCRTLVKSTHWLVFVVVVLETVAKGSGDDEDEGVVSHTPQSTGQLLFANKLNCPVTKQDASRAPDAQMEDSSTPLQDRGTYFVVVDDGSVDVEGKVVRVVCLLSMLQWWKSLCC